MVYSDMKICSKCKSELPETSFYKHKRTRDGLRQQCKSCTDNKSKEWAKNNPETVLELARKNYHRNKDKILERGKRYRKENPLSQERKDELKEYHKIWHAENKDRMAEYYRNYYLENREEINAYNAAWQKSTPERIEKRNRQGKRYRENNPEKVLAAQRSWNERNRDKKVAYVRNRRAREDGAEGFFTGDDWAEIKEKYDHRCIKCFLQEPEIKLTPDHVVPLFLGGTNWPSNIQPLCGKCNSSKGPKFIEFRPERLLNGATVNV